MNAAVNIGDMLFCLVPRQVDSIFPETILTSIYVDKIVIEMTADGNDVKYYGGGLVISEKDIGDTAFTNLDEALAQSRALAAC